VNRVRELAHEIQSLHAEFGTTNDICDRFLDTCGLYGSNIAGEPKLAATLLAEILPRLTV